MNTELTVRDWKRIDKAFENMEYSMIECCVVLSEYEDTQEEIAKHRNMSQSTIAQMMIVGKNSEKFITTSNNLPTGWRSLYLLSDMTKNEIKRCCSNRKNKYGELRPPTQKEIQEFRIEIGRDEPKKKPKQLRVDGDSIEELAMLIPPAAIEGLSEFGRRSLFQQHEKINEKLGKLEATLHQKDRKAVMVLLVEILKYQQTVFNAELRRQVKEELENNEEVRQVRERAAKLDKRESEFAKRSTRMKHVLSETEIKLIQSCLHPDKIINGDVNVKRYERAFDAFRRAI